MEGNALTVQRFKGSRLESPARRRQAGMRIEGFEDITAWCPERELTFLDIAD